MYTILFNATGVINLYTEKRNHARVIQDALTAAGIASTVSVNKTVDLTPKPKKTVVAGTAKTDKKTGKK